MKCPLIQQAILLDNKVCRHSFCLQALNASSNRATHAVVTGAATWAETAEWYYTYILFGSLPTSSTEQHCANVTLASSLLHLAALRSHFPRHFPDFPPRTHISCLNVLPGNLKIIQHKVAFYGEHKASGYSIFMWTLCERCKIMIRIVKVTAFVKISPSEVYMIPNTYSIQFYQ